MTTQEALQTLRAADPLRITISGDIGSGKSTFSKRLAAELELPRIYIGQLMREEAAKRNMTLDEFNKLLEKDDTIDRYMDALQKTKSEETTRGVFEGRVAWHFVVDPKITVFFSVDPQVAAERIWQDKNGMRDEYASPEALATGNIERKASEEMRYQNYYGISAYNHENFDIVINTTHLSIEEVYATTVQAIAAKL
jgi:cytidylate kinase